MKTKERKPKRFELLAEMYSPTEIDRVRSHDTIPVEWDEADHLVAIDPGLQGTGIASWVCGDLSKAAVLNVPSNGRGWAWTRRADYIANQVVTWLPAREAPEERRNTVVICEYPEAFGGVKMMAWKTGDLVKLAYLVGLFSGRVVPAKFVPVPVNTWKGQLPKDVVIDRLKKRLGHAKVRAIAPDSHAWDAIGIGMWARGEF